MNLQDAQRILVNEQRLDAVVQFLATKFPEDFENPQQEKKQVAKAEKRVR